MNLINVVTAVTATLASGLVVSQQPCAIGVTTSALNIREGNSTNFKVLFTVPQGVELDILEESGGWYKIRYQNKEGWGYGEYITKKEEKGDIRYVSGIQRVSLRRDPSYSGEFLGHAYEGDKVEVLGKIGDFSRIKYNGKISYVVSEYLVEKNPVHKKYVSGIDKLSLREGANSASKFMGYVYEGESIEVVGYDNSFAHIKYNGKMHYVMKSYLVDKNPIEYKYVENIDKLTVRSTPSTNSSNNVLGSVLSGQRLQVLGYEGSFARIKYGDRQGYVLFKGYLEDYSEKVIDGINSASIMSGATYDSAKLGNISSGSKVQEYGVIGNWSKIKYGNSYGYVESKYTADIKYVDGIDQLSLRKTPNTTDKNNFIGHIPKGRKVVIVDYDGSWAKIRYGSGYAYVMSQYLVRTSEAPIEYIDVNPLEVSTVNTRYTTVDDVGVYVNPLISNELKGLLVKGSHVEYVSELNNEFIKVKINNTIEGYVNKKQVSHRNPFAKNTESRVTKQINMKHSEYVEGQKDKPYVSIEDVRHYSNPVSYSLDNKEERYQFLKLDAFRNINAYELNQYLNNLEVKPGKDAIFKNQAQAFINAAKKYNIDPIYLVAHTMLETGYGSSTLAQGIVVDKDAAGNSVKPAKVHNLFGIGAVDSDPLGGGSKTAYALGWTNIPKAIEGAAKWIAEGVPANASVGLKASDGYIHSAKHDHQYTLYAMRWDYVRGWHQYATDPKWPMKISRLMSTIDYMYEGAKLVFENIQYIPEAKISYLDRGVENFAVLNSDTYLKSGPGVGYKDEIFVKKGEKVIVRGYVDGYALIEYNGKEYFINKELLDAYIEIEKEDNENVIEDEKEVQEPVEDKEDEDIIENEGGEIKEDEESQINKEDALVSENDEESLAELR